MPTDVRANRAANSYRFLAESPLLYGSGGALAATTAFAQEGRRVERRLRLQGPHQERR